MKQRKLTLEDVNRLPKEAMAPSRPRETLATFTSEYDQQQQIKKTADLEASLAPIKREQAKLLAELREKELREIKRRLILQPSPEAGFIPYSGSLRPDEVTQKINEACSLFLETDGSNLTKQQLNYFREFMHVNRDLVDLTSASQWSKAWFYVQSKLNPPEPEQAVSDPMIETPEQTREVASGPVLDRDSRDKQDRQVRDAEWVTEFTPVFREAVDSLERSSGLVMQHPQMLELAAHFDKRRANSKRPIPMSVFELRKTAYQLWGNEIGPIENDRSFLMDEDSQLTSEELKAKYGFANSYSKNIAIAADSWRK